MATKPGPRLTPPDRAAKPKSPQVVAPKAQQHLLTKNRACARSVSMLSYKCSLNGATHLNERNRFPAW